MYKLSMRFCNSLIIAPPNVAVGQREYKYSSIKLIASLMREAESKFVRAILILSVWKIRKSILEA